MFKWFNIFKHELECKRTCILSIYDYMISLQFPLHADATIKASHAMKWWDNNLFSSLSVKMPTSFQLLKGAGFQLFSVLCNYILNVFGYWNHTINLKKSWGVISYYILIDLTMNQILEETAHRLIVNTIIFSCSFNAKRLQSCVHKAQVGCHTGLFHKAEPANIKTMYLWNLYTWFRWAMWSVLGLKLCRRGH